MEVLQEFFNYEDLTDTEQDTLYKNFSDTYIDSTGAAFDRDDFDWRANNWEFYGDISGGVTVRRQRSGLLKLTSSYESIDPATGKHNTIGVLKGLESLMKENPDTPIWGAMPNELAKMLAMVSKRKCPDNAFSNVPGVLVVALGKKLMKAVGSSDPISVVANPLDKNFGCIVMSTPAGPMAKRLVANTAYYDWLKASAKDKSNDMIQEAISKLGGLGKFLNLLPKSNKAKADTVEIEDQTLSDEEDIEDTTNDAAAVDDTPVTDDAPVTDDSQAITADDKPKKQSLVARFFNRNKNK